MSFLLVVKFVPNSLIFLGIMSDTFRAGLKLGLYLQMGKLRHSKGSIGPRSYMLSVTVWG